MMILHYITKIHINVVIYKLQQQNLFKLDQNKNLINLDDDIALPYKN